MFRHGKSAALYMAIKEAASVVYVQKMKRKFANQSSATLYRTVFRLQVMRFVHRYICRCTVWAATNRRRCHWQLSVHLCERWIMPVIRLRIPIKCLATLESGARESLSKVVKKRCFVGLSHQAKGKEEELDDTILSRSVWTRCTTCTAIINFN